MWRFCLRNIALPVFLLCCCSARLAGQQRTTGAVLNKETGKGIPSASVKLVGTAEGTSCDSTGRFSLTVRQPFPVDLLVSAVGYQDVVRSVPSAGDGLTFLLEPDARTIDAVEISRKQKYNNRNPAVELIRQVIRHKRDNRSENYPKLHFQQYDKLQFGLANPRVPAGRVPGDWRFFFENTDTLTAPGNALLTLLMREQISDVYSRKSPKASKKIVRSLVQTDYDERYINNANIQTYISHILREVEIYDDNILLIDKSFLSPIAGNAPALYKYYIADTVQTAEGRFVELNFEPRNPADVLLRGTLQITTDGRYAVRSAELKADRRANLNWVNDLLVVLTYKPNAEGQMFLDRSDLRLLLGAGSQNTAFGRRTTRHYAYDFAPTFADAVFAGAPAEIAPGARANKRDVFDRRPIELTEAEEKVYAHVDSLNSNRKFRTVLAVGYLLAQGYHSMGGFEAGPLEYTYSINNIEGNRIRLGGRTTAAFSGKLFVESYLAYGLRDARVKYFAAPAFSLNGKAVSAFPAHYLRLAAQHDIFEPGRGTGFQKGDSFFRSIRSDRPTKWLDSDIYQIRHLLEFGNHVSFRTALTHHRRTPIGDLELPSSADPNLRLATIHTNDLELMLRWAPRERFYFRNLSREAIPDKYPVFNVQYNRGLRGVWDGGYAYDALRGAVSKRFFLNPFGFADVTLAGGKIWGTLPYLLLEVPDVYRNESWHDIEYSMMQSAEFVADRYVRFAIEQQLQGFVLNKLPLVKKLKLREILGARMFYGSLSPANNPYTGSGVVRFDTDRDGRTMTHVLRKTPYWEGTIGLDNVFRALKVEYIRRLNYLDLPQAEKYRFWVTLNLSF